MSDVPLLLESELEVRDQEVPEFNSGTSCANVVPLPVDFGVLSSSRR
jgi:hypothetical protein